MPREQRSQFFPQTLRFPPRTALTRHKEQRSWHFSVIFFRKILQKLPHYSILACSRMDLSKFHKTFRLVFFRDQNILFIVFAGDVLGIAHSIVQCDDIFFQTHRAGKTLNDLYSVVVRFRSASIVLFQVVVLPGQFMGKRMVQPFLDILHTTVDGRQTDDSKLCLQSLHGDLQRDLQLGAARFHPHHRQLIHHDQTAVFQDLAVRLAKHRKQFFVDQNAHIVGSFDQIAVVLLIVAGTGVDLFPCVAKISLELGIALFDHRLQWNENQNLFPMGQCIDDSKLRKQRLAGRSRRLNNQVFPLKIFLTPMSKKRFILQCIALQTRQPKPLGASRTVLHALKHRVPIISPVLNAPLLYQRFLDLQQVIHYANSSSRCSCNESSFKIERTQLRHSAV